MTNDERDTLINSILPDTVKGQQRPAENINPDMPYSTDFPQLINKDPASADVFNLINRQLLSNDKSLNDNKADKTYVDKKVADLVNGAPEQLDTLQELSKALNNDKDYAATVNNALAEKLGRTEKAVSAGTADYAKAADAANKLQGYPLAPPGGDNPFGKVPVVSTDGVLEIGKCIDFHSKNGDGKDYSTRIEANDDGTISISGGVNANLNGNASSADTLTGFIRADNVGNDWGNQTGELVANFFPGAKGGTIAFRVDNPVKGEVSMIIDGVVYQREGLYKCIDENSINDYLAGAGIVSQQLASVGYIKYYSGLVYFWGFADFSGHKYVDWQFPLSIKRLLQSFITDVLSTSETVTEYPEGQVSMGWLYGTATENSVRLVSTRDLGLVSVFAIGLWK